MITKENGLKYAKLIHVSVDNGRTDNSNKVYIMEELSDGRIKCEYGRVGKSLTTEYKDASKWNSVYKQKTGKSKGYTDVTELLAEAVEDGPKANLGIDSIVNNIVRKLVKDLMDFANKSIQKNYRVSQDSVSEQQVEKAQEILSYVTSLVEINGNVKLINDKLLELFTIIPRKMDNVKYHLIDSLKTASDLEVAQKLLGNEQSTLDTMAGQVQLIKPQKETGEPLKDITILEQMGLSIELEENDEKLSLVHKLLGSNSNRAKNIFKVINHKTQKRFDEHFNKTSVKKKRYYWHGSRNENWLNICQTGLLIRPSGAVYTGSMFGDGIYFANKSQKSLGYSSLSGSYWTKGNSNVGYLALFDVHVGKQKDIFKHDSSCYRLSQSVMDTEGYDSVYAHGGADLRNDEFIIYNPAQCTIAYLIEMN